MASYENEKPGNRQALIITGFILFVVALGRIATNEFTERDDGILIARNPNFNPPTISSVLTFAFPKNALIHLYIPLTSFVWGILAWLGYLHSPDDRGSHLNPAVFHGASLAFHLASTVLVFLCIDRILSIDRLRRRFWPAWVGAMVFAIHPLQVESVAWASGLKDVLSGFFALAALYSFLWFRSIQSGAAGWSIWRWYALATTCFVLSMLSKPAAVAVPIGLVVIDRFCFRTRLSASFRTFLPWALLALPIYLIARNVQPVGWRDLPPPSIFIRPLIAADALAFYVGKLIAPFDLRYDYGRTPATVLATALPYWDWIVPIGIFLICLVAKQRTPLMAYLFAIAMLLPVLGFVPFGSQDFSTVADHYLYLPMFAVGLVIAAILYRFPGPFSSALAWLAIAGCCVQSFCTTGVWADDEHLARNVLAIDPNNWDALNDLGANECNSGQIAEGVALFQKSLALYPRYGTARKNLADAYFAQNKPREAFDQLQLMMRNYRLENGFDPSRYAQTQLSYASMMLKHDLPDLAIIACTAALAEDPHRPEALKMLAECQRRIRSNGNASTRSTTATGPSVHDH
ncbi:MAG: hypothetical protein JO353_13515 [Phycisphaerae bacterium]|nr:hypothetical protein [Phycisphaerae bacterium]